MNVSARVRGIFARMRSNVKKSIPKFLDRENQKEIWRLLKETRSHGLPNFVSDSIFQHMTTSQILPVLRNNARTLIAELSRYITIVLQMLVHEVFIDTFTWGDNYVTLEASRIFHILR